MKKDAFVKMNVYYYVVILRNDSGEIPLSQPILKQQQKSDTYPNMKSNPI